MKKNKFLYASLLLVLFTPIVSFAALGGIKSLLEALKELINLTFPVMIGLAIIFFFWGIGQFILNDAGNDKTREDGKKKMLWGVIALFVMVSIWGILNWISGTIGIPINTSSNSSTGTPCDPATAYQTGGC